MQNGQLFQQVMWEPVINENASGLLRTPTTGMVNQDRSQDPSYMSKLMAKGQTVTLAAQMKSKEMALLPTPRRGETSDLKSTPGNHFSLSAWARQGHWMLPTPTAGDSKNRGYFYQRTNGVVTGWNPSLCGAVGAAKVPTTLPNGLLAPQIHNVQGSPLNGPPMHLAPSFVEEMMGYPIGWTDLSS
jgi:hypothetical protein